MSANVGRGALLRTALTVVIIGLYGLLARTAYADPTTIVVFVDGPGAAPVREAVGKAIPVGVEIADSKRFRTELTRAGQAKPFTTFDAKTLKRIRRATAATGAEAAIIARVRNDKTGRVVRLLVVDVVAETGPSIIARLGLKPADADGEVITAALGHSLDAYAPPPTQAPVAPEPQAETVDTTPAEPSPIAPIIGPPPIDKPPPPPSRTSSAQLLATSLIDVALGIEAAGRSYAFENGIAPRPYAYRLRPSPEARVTGTIFPLAGSGSPLGDLGIAFDYGRIFVGKGDLDGGPSSAGPTSYSLSLRGRLHPGLARGDPPVIIGIAVGYAFSSFGLVGPANAELPDVAYRTLRPALDARIPIGNFSILGGVAFRALVDAKHISTRLNEPKGFGLDAQLGVAFMFVRHFEGRLLARYERYGLDAKRPPGATFRAASATDESYSACAALALIF